MAMPLLSGRPFLVVLILTLLAGLLMQNTSCFDLFLSILESVTMHHHHWPAALGAIGLQFQGVTAQPTVTNADTGVKYLGASANGVEQFENIFFGQETNGSNRFAPPLPFTYPPGSRVLANVSGAACPQPQVPVVGFEFLFSNVTNQSEDCLSLRIARPAGTKPESKLPVMVWLYGGIGSRHWTH